MVSRVTRTTILLEFICVMSVWNQACQSSVASLKCLASQIVPSTSILRQSVSTLVIVLPLIPVPLSFCSPARLPYRMITRLFVHYVSPTLVFFTCCCCCKFVIRTFLGIPRKYSRPVCIHVESILSTRGPAMMSDSVGLWDTDVCFLHILMETIVQLPTMHKSPPEVDFESSRPPAKSESWNKPSRQCCAVFPTWQLCRKSFVWWM